jgi:CHAD domain-containing protein
MSVALLRSSLLKTRLEWFSRAIRGTEKGDVRSLHRARIASRRLRELIPMLQLDAGVSRKLGRRLRRVTARLGSVRDLDVLALLSEDLQATLPRHRDALIRVGAAVSKSRDTARKRLRERVPVDEMNRLARKLDRTVVALGDEEAAKSLRRAARAWQWAMEARLGRRAARLVSAIDAAGAVYLPDRLHDVRISLKKFRYALELAAEVNGTQKMRPLRDLKRAQVLLGRMRDMQMLIDRVREVQASLAPPSLTAWRDLDALVVALDESCRRLHARYVRERELLHATSTKIASRPSGTAPRNQRRAG